MLFRVHRMKIRQSLDNHLSVPPSYLNLKAADAEKAILEVMDEFQSTECEFDTESFSYSEARTEMSPVKPTGS
ncbi:hypothetical protein AHF37_01392 [Paragonimus kellicotti]|nr:hypothetical protein AHF37_01392 [Paragonimus kellicotti]